MVNKKIENRPLAEYLNLNYPVTIYSAPEGGFVAEIEELAGCITEGETLEEAYKRIEDVKKGWMEIAYEDGADIPLPRTDVRYSGKFVVRIPKSLHRQLAEQAQREGISLNQYVESLLSSKATVQDIKNIIQESFEREAEEATAEIIAWGSYPWPRRSKPMEAPVFVGHSLHLRLTENLAV